MKKKADKKENNVPVVDEEFFDKMSKAMTKETSNGRGDDEEEVEEQ